jgi:hypothetical protein
MHSLLRLTLAFTCAAALPVAASAQPAADPHQHDQAAPAAAEPGHADAPGEHRHAQGATAAGECPCCAAMRQMHGGQHAAPEQPAPDHPQDAPEHQGH